jgi:cation:H+ antiporter
MPNHILLQVIIYLVCFLFVWIGSGLVVSSVASLAKSWRLPAFIISFFLLGLLTSLPEITISTISILNNDPVIVAGNLLGGVIVMFLGIIPLLGIVGNGVKIPTQLDHKQMVITLLVVIAPAFLTADQKLGQWEAGFLVLLYLSLFVFFSFKQSFWEKIKNGLQKKKKHTASLLMKITTGVLILIVASNQIVNSTLYFADLLSISPFFVSLIVVALGTNIPELSIVFRSVLNKKKDIALADYLGSASANTLLLGVFTLLYGKTIQLPNHFFQRFSFLAVGLVLFYFFARTKNTISRRESIALLLMYITFVTFELVIVTRIAQ